MQKTVCQNSSVQIQGIWKTVGVKCADDLLRPVKISSVHLMETLLSHKATREDNELQWSNAGKSRESNMAYVVCTNFTIPYSYCIEP